MTLHRITPIALALACVCFASPATAEVTQASDSGFVVTRTIDLPADDVTEAWEALVHPERWWSADHTWSGDPVNLSLAPVAGGCFCELLPAVLPDGSAGSVEHMRVIHVRPRALLVLRGALGPLQGEALVGTLTITLEPGEASGASRMTWTYVVGGHARFPLPAVAPAVDAVLGEQLQRLANHAQATD